VSAMFRTPYVAALGGGPFAGQERPLLATREYAYDEPPPDKVHVALCPCCDRVVVWDGIHPRANLLPEPLVYQQLAVELGGKVHYEPEEPCS
jgi:hypothetical protein